MLKSKYVTSCSQKLTTTLLLLKLCNNFFCNITLYFFIKQTAAPQNVTFVLAKVSPYDTTTDLYIGSRVKFRLDISFPVAPTDMLVELFTPDNDTTVMILCDIVVTKGSGLAITGSTDVTMESKTPGSVLVSEIYSTFFKIVYPCLSG